MPWHISTSQAGCSGYAVVLNATGKTVGCHPTKAKAQAQLAALNINAKSLNPMEAEGMQLRRTNLVRDIAPELAEVEVRSTDDGVPTISGHFAVFNEWARIDSVHEGTFMEQIAPGAFTESFAKATPKIMFQHGRDPSVGEMPIAGPALVREDERGAAYSAPLVDGVPEMLVSGLERGLYGASFRFGVDQDSFAKKGKVSEHNPDGLPERTITKATVYEGGPVTWGAYSGATAQVRSGTDEFWKADLDAELDRLVREHPKELAKRIARVLKAEAPQPRFRTREDFLQWMTRS